MAKEIKRSKWWLTMVDILDGQFPKKKCQERGQAMVMLAYIEMMLLGIKFGEDGMPLCSECQFESGKHSPQCSKYVLLPNPDEEETIGKLVRDLTKVGSIPKSEARRRIEKILRIQKNIPMGVSQWRNHGKKYGYWEYFEKESK